MQLVYAEGSAGYSGIFDEYACRSGLGLGQTGGPRTVAQCPSPDVTRYTTQSRIAGNPNRRKRKATGLRICGHHRRHDADRRLLPITLEDAHCVDRRPSCRTSDCRPASPRRLGVRACRNWLSPEHPRRSRAGIALGSAVDLRSTNINTSFINAATSALWVVSSTTADHRHWGSFRQPYDDELSDECQ